MAEPTPSTSPAGDDRNLVRIDDSYLNLSLEDKLTMFWEKNGRAISFVVAAVAVSLVAKWGFDQYAAARSRAISAEYAAATDSAALAAFRAAHPSTQLAGAAALRLADEAYSTSRYTEAAKLYAEAAPLLGGQPLADRARLGLAISQLQAGDAAAKSTLETLANDTALSGTLRAESAFHLAVLARDASATAEARRWSELALSVQPQGLWAQRAMQLASELPVAQTTAQTGEINTEVTFPSPSK